MTELQAFQSDKFKDAAREAACDEDEARWTDRLKKVAVTPPICAPKLADDELDK